jgi:hypothetical protein
LKYRGVSSNKYLAWLHRRASVTRMHLADCNRLFKSHKRAAQHRESVFTLPWMRIPHAAEVIAEMRAMSKPESGYGRASEPNNTARSYL